jgi:dsRNA-specific ribonuclease
MNESTNEQPLSDILFQAITRRSSGEQMDNENLEVLGDCFLKLAVSMSLYHRYPLANAGLLTVEKTKQISNENLYRIAIRKDLNPFDATRPTNGSRDFLLNVKRIECVKTYLNVKKIDFRGKNANWLPPGYKVHETKMIIGERYTHQNAKRKAFSDMIEAFIGAFLISSNYTTTIKFMDWLGLDVIPLDRQGREIL